MRPQSTVMQRWQMIEMTNGGLSDRQAAKAGGYSRWTVRKWRRRYQKNQAQGLSSVIGRPKKGSLSSYPEELRNEILELRQVHPHWGPLQLRSTLAQAPAWQGQRLPSRARIAAFLKAQGLVRSYQKHSDLPQPSPAESGEPHAEWQIDAQGQLTVAPFGKLVPINIIDRATGLYIHSEPCLQVPRPGIALYQLALRCAFLKWGLPEQISTDHEGVFIGQCVASPFPTRLTLWLVALGIQLRLIHKPPPLEHAQIERAHQIYQAQIISTQPYTCLAALQEWVAQRCDFLNRHFPSARGQNQPLLSTYPQALTNPRQYRLEWEENLLVLQRVYTYLAQGRWFRHVAQTGQFNLGNQRYGLGVAWAKQDIEVTFDFETTRFVCRSLRSDRVTFLAPRHLTKAYLMGEIAPALGGRPYQLGLPFDPCHCRINTALATGTTL